MTTTTKRPSYHSDTVRVEAAKRLLPKVLDRLKSEGDDYPASEHEAIVNELADAFHDEDGYQVAKNLDDWSMNADWVDFFDGHVGSMCRSVHEEKVKAWVVEQAIVLEYPEGTRVEYKERFQGSRVGVVIKRLNETAQYVIVVPELGDKTPEEAEALRKAGSRQSFTTGRYILAEDVVKAVPSP